MSSLEAYSLRSICEFSAQRLSHHTLQMTIPFSFGILNFGGKSKANLKFPMISWPYSALMLIGFLLVLMVLYCLSSYSKRILLVDKLQSSFYLIYRFGCVTLLCSHWENPLCAASLLPASISIISSRFSAAFAPCIWQVFPWTSSPRQQDTFGFEVLLRCFSFYKVFPSAQLPRATSLLFLLVDALAFDLLFNLLLCRHALWLRLKIISLRLQRCFI